MFRRVTLVFAALGFLTVGNAAQAQVPTFKNGDFEGGVEDVNSTGWDLINSTNTPCWTPVYGNDTIFPRINLNKDCGGPYGNNNEGCHFVTIGGMEDSGTSKLLQTIPGFVVGKSYIWSWRQSSEGGHMDVVNASVIGAAMVSADFTSDPYPGDIQFWYNWQTMCMPFVADATTLTFSFHSYDTYNGTNSEPGIDDVRLSTQPDLTTDFVARRRGSEISVGPATGAPPPTAINFSGSAGAASDTWVTVYEPPLGPTCPSPSIFIDSISLSADVLIAKFNNAKGPGLLALYNQPPSAGAKGLALFLIDNGNTDRLVLATVTGSPEPPPPASAPVTLATKPLGGGIQENHWYRLTLDVCVTRVGPGVPPTFSVTGKVFTHTNPLDPNSGLLAQVDGSLVFPSPPSPSPTLASKGLTDSGEVGIAATATSAVVNSSVTNFVILPACSCP